MVADSIIEITTLVAPTAKIRILPASIEAAAIMNAFCFVTFPEGKGRKGRSFRSSSMSK